ncbi:MAG: aldehyde ferredoxin oxidoreductase N-terminal domain-containing protein [Coriobacteriia bacterium]
MANGYAGRILKIDLTTKTTEEIPTSDYEQWGGGHGMGSALFWDLCEDKTVAGTDPKNVVTIMTSPLSGTLTPAAAGRTEIQGIGLQGSPLGWFTRSNFGGRFGTQLKYAGWDGIAILGKSEEPVWINILDGAVTFEDAADLWGLDTWETQQDIWRMVNADEGNWHASGTSRDRGRTTQRPAVVTCGPNADKYGPLACLIHDAGNGAGQGGFGGVFASKNLKAVSVLGTGGIEIADPNALMESRLWLQDGYTSGAHMDDPQTFPGIWALSSSPGQTLGPYPAGTYRRPQGCVGCVKNCRARTSTGLGNESMCIDAIFMSGGVQGGPESLEDSWKSTDLAQRYGLNVFSMMGGLAWLQNLYKAGILGAGKAIDSSLDYEHMGTEAFVSSLFDAILNHTDIGADLSLGLWQCAEKWGRLEEDLDSGFLSLMCWGYVHHYDGRTEAEWGYGSLMGERDINEHDFNWVVYWCSTVWNLTGTKPPVTAEEMAKIITDKMAPYAGDMNMVDYSDEGIYSESMAKTVAWHRHYTRYYKQSLGFCDWGWADFLNAYGPDYVGATGEGEPRFFNAVTGKNQSFEEGVEVGRKIWNLDRAIWALQGRTREMEVYAGYMYNVGSTTIPGVASIGYEVPYIMPVHENGEWKYKNLSGRKLDRQKVEDWKTRFYTLEGWDTTTGQPTRGTLEELGLGNVADVLETAGKLGKA